MNCIASIKNLSPGNHLCFIYKTEEENRAIITPFIRYGLEKGEKVLYIVDARTEQDLIYYLNQQGLRTSDYISSGQLIVLNSSDIYFQQGKFDPDSVIGLWKKETDKALKEGYKALRVTGKASWVLRNIAGSERLMEYEAKLNQLLPEIRAICLCQYDMRIFEPETLLDVLSTHPVAVVNNRCHDNIYFIPPDEFLGSKKSEAELHHRLLILEIHRRYKKTLDKTKKNYLELFYNSPWGISLTDSVGKLRLMNPEMARMIGASSPEEAIECVHDVSTDLYVDPRKRKELVQALEGKGQVENFEYEARDLQGRPFWLSINAWIRKWQTNGTFIIEEFASDITSRKQAEEKVKQLNLRLRAIHSVNQLIIRETDPEKLIRGVCYALVENRGYHSAWIVLLDKDRVLQSSAEAGLGEGFLSMAEKIKKGNLPCCAKMAQEKSNVVVIKDPPSFCSGCPLASCCVGRSTMTAPLEHKGRIYGFLTTSIANLFEAEEEKELFQEIAGDIALALDKIRNERER